MRKFYLALFSIILLSSMVSALDCQYDEPVYTEIEKNISHYHGEKLDFHILEVGDIISDGWWNGIWPDQKREAGFTVYNKYDKAINVTVLFTNNGAEDSEALNLDALGFSKINRGIGGKIIVETIRFEFEDSEISMGSEAEEIETARVCEICPSGKECLDDGEVCTIMSENSNECGSKICNINLICGAIGTSSIVSCPSGFENCKDESCLKINGKDFPDGYKCELECLHGGKDGKCLEDPEVIQSRIDEEARIQQEYEDKVRRNWIIFGIVAFIIFSILIAKFALIPYIKKRKEEEGRAKDAISKKQIAVDERLKEEEKLKSLQKESDILNDRIERNQEEIKKLDDKRNKLKKRLTEEEKISNKKIKSIRDKFKKEIVELERKKKNKSNEAKGAIDKEITKLRNIRRKEIESAEEEGKKKLNHLKKTIRQNESLRSEEEKMKNKLSKSISEKNNDIREIERTSPERRIKKLKNKYQRMYGGGSKEIIFDKNEKRFKIKYPDGVKRLSREIYKRVDSKIYSKDAHVHHIDCDELNDVLENLVALPSKVHSRYGKFNHYDVEKGNWLSGIDELKKQLSMKESDFPEHIQKEIKKRKQQQQLGKYSHRANRGKKIRRK